MFLFEIITGAVAALLALRLFHYEKEEIVKGFVALALVVAAFIYAAIAGVSFLNGSTETKVLLSQIAGVGVFFVLAYLGVTRSMWFIAIGWLGHVLWDIAVNFIESGGVAPEFYSRFCIGFDLVSAAYIFWRFRLVTRQIG